MKCFNKPEQNMPPQFQTRRTRAIN